MGWSPSIDDIEIRNLTDEVIKLRQELDAVNTNFKDAIKAAFIDGYTVGYDAYSADQLRPWLKETPEQAWETSDSNNTLRGYK